MITWKSLVQPRSHQSFKFTACQTHCTKFLLSNPFPHYRDFDISAVFPSMYNSYQSFCSYFLQKFPKKLHCIFYRPLEQLTVKILSFATVVKISCQWAPLSSGNVPCKTQNAKCISRIERFSMEFCSCLGFTALYCAL